jgi:hypothetical protein
LPLSHTTRRLLCHNNNCKLAAQQVRLLLNRQVCWTRKTTHCLLPLTNYRMSPQQHNLAKIQSWPASYPGKLANRSRQCRRYSMRQHYHNPTRLQLVHKPGRSGKLANRLRQCRRYSMRQHYHNPTRLQLVHKPGRSHKS